jgi:hypothetical protein
MFKHNLVLIDTTTSKAPKAISDQKLERKAKTVTQKGDEIPKTAKRRANGHS